MSMIQSLVPRLAKHCVLYKYQLETLAIDYLSKNAQMFQPNRNSFADTIWLCDEWKRFVSFGVLKSA